MTTVGVPPDPLDRTLPMKIPSYSYQYPSLRSIQLAAVKEGLYHPRIPSFRRMDMDTAAHKLPDEHCRTTTTCGPENFRRATTTLFSPPSKRLSSMNVTETGRKLHRYYTTPEELNKTRSEWSEFLNRCPERYNIRLPELPENKDLHFSGYAVRYLKPEISASWRRSVPRYISALPQEHRDAGLAPVNDYSTIEKIRAGCGVSDVLPSKPDNLKTPDDVNNHYSSVYTKDFSRTQSALLYPRF
ncbi:sperm microtubule inner protein 8-like isoform X1 [Tubulanus polymorphus]|uniref:sperm microtubule inner protein 8-like isoform X1 n=1 Tax=Tubulanus polymorphus TaxID=672921 RepID=UPI003DA452A9